MGEKGLPLTESTVASCQESGCPWLEGGFCGLTGQLLMQINLSNIKSQGFLSFERDKGGAYTHSDTDWVVENHQNFSNFSLGCVISSMNRAQLEKGRLPSPLILTSGGVVQYVNNIIFALNQKHQMLKVTPNSDSQTVVVNRVIYSPDVR